MIHDDNGNPNIFTRNDGTPGAAFEVNAQTVRFLSSRGEVTETGEPRDNGASELEPEPAEAIEF